ncbi:hypothetical protein GH733_010994, partial [Mirounga leonina]
LSTSSPSIPLEFCRNGGTWEYGGCICPDLWKGWRCTITNFCEKSTYESLTFDRIPVGKYGSSQQRCDKDTLNAGNPIATRLCSITIYGEIELQNVTIGNCNETLETLEKQIVNISTQSLNISAEAQILTSDVNRITPEGIISATRVVGQIFNSTRNAVPEAKVIAVTTVSQLLDAGEDVFRKAAATASDKDDTLATLIKQMEIYSTSLGNTSVVKPNVAVQSVAFSSESTMESLNVRFSVRKGNNTTACGFVVYQNNKLFQSKSFKAKSDFSQKVISSSTDKNNLQGTSVDIVFKPRYDQKEFQLHSYACVYWNQTTKDWDTDGCDKNGSTNDFFFEKKYKYPESLNIISSVGCALSITGLALTIVFQIVTRNVRKTSVTWVLVCLCTSMLIFNLLFVFGIENSNKNLKKSESSTGKPDSGRNEMLMQDTVDIGNPTCTVVAALLHYFLLVTFTWTGLSAAQLYFLLIRTMRPLPQHFILFVSLIGWGVPAVVVVVTVGIIFSQSGSQWELNYRQEEICWLAVSGNSGLISSPLLWSFMIPITIILINNIVIFIIIIVKVIWKTNQNLTSTKNVSFLKKILSTLSITVVFGVTWILAYFMLIGNDDVRIIFNYMFCLFNTT